MLTTMRFRKHFFLLVSVLALSGCSAFNNGKVSQDMLPWREPGQIIYQDDFSDNTSGWEEVSNVYELKGYSTSGYMISINQPDSRTISTTGLSFSNTLTDVNVQKITGSRTSQFGLVCRFQDKYNYYSFVISSDGYAAIVRYVDGQGKLLGSEQMIRAEGINLDDGSNSVSAACVDNNLRLVVNNDTIVRAKDDTFKNGDIGFFVETFDVGSSTVVFSDLIIVKP